MSESPPTSPDEVIPPALSDIMEAGALYVVGCSPVLRFNLPEHWGLAIAYSDRNAIFFHVLGGAKKWTKQERHYEDLLGRKDVCLILKVAKPGQVRLRQLEDIHHQAAECKVDNKDRTWTSKHYVESLLKCLHIRGHINVISFPMLGYEMDRQLASAQAVKRERSAIGRKDAVVVNSLSSTS